MDKNELYLRRPALAWLCRLAGAAMLLAGGGLALLTPLEVQCYAWFAPGGRFAYPGFGYGSFMFANITLQIAGYALLAALLLPLGYGHLRRCAWSAVLMRGALLAWLALGLPIALAALAVLYMQKDLSLAAGLAFGALAVLTYPAAPLLLLRLYRSQAVAALWPCAPRDAARDRELALGLILTVSAMIAATPALFRGFFPLLIGWLSGPLALALNALSALGLLALAVAWWQAPGHGLPRLRWLTLALFGGHGAAWVLTLAHTPWLELVALLPLGSLELQMLSGAPLHGAYLAALLALPLVITLGLALGVRREAPPSP